MGLFLFGVAATGGVWYLLYNSEAESHRTALHRWDAAMAVWESLYYCPKCDHVFDPLSVRACRSNDIISFYPPY